MRSLAASLFFALLAIGTCAAIWPATFKEILTRGFCE